MTKGEFISKMPLPGVPCLPLQMPCLGPERLACGLAMGSLAPWSPAASGQWRAWRRRRESQDGQGLLCRVSVSCGPWDLCPSSGRHSSCPAASAHLSLASRNFLALPPAAPRHSPGQALTGPPGPSQWPLYSYRLQTQAGCVICCGRDDV